MKDKKLYQLISESLDGAKNMLDIGCGEGELCSYLEKNLEKNIIGLDITESGFTKAKRTAALVNASKLVRCVRGDAHSMPYFKAGEFDAISMIYTLHHIGQPEIALLEIKRVLKPNGKMIVADYVIDRSVAQTDCHKFVFSNMEDLLLKAGFSLSEKRRLEPDLAFFIAVK
jgi:ubiquinone/menaquinone biosynthesis C-methylase UbiE